VTEQAMSSPRIQPYLEGHEVVKVITVPEKLINIVVR
jgi:leucyl-tRNA synthetase